ncbi:hypothetical protein LINPERHAP2_LOCUS3331, partial [Linum perenne]
IGYTRWVYHGEQFNAALDDINMLDNDENEDVDDNEDEEDNFFDLLDEHANYIHNEDDLEANQVFYINDPKLGINWRVFHQINHRHIFIGEFESQNDDDTEYNDDAYQDEELSNEASRVVEIGVEIEQSLRRDDVVPDPITRVIQTSQDEEDDINSESDTSEEEVDYNSENDSD